MVKDLVYQTFNVKLTPIVKNLVYRAFNVNIAKLGRDVKAKIVEPSKIIKAKQNLFDNLQEKGYQVLVEQSIICGAPREFIVGGEIGRNIKGEVYSRAALLGNYLRSGNWYTNHILKKSTKKDRK